MSNMFYGELSEGSDMNVIRKIRCLSSKKEGRRTAKIKRGDCS